MHGEPFTRRYNLHNYANEPAGRLEGSPGTFPHPGSGKSRPTCVSRSSSPITKSRSSFACHPRMEAIGLIASRVTGRNRDAKSKIRPAVSIG